MKSQLLAIAFAALTAASPIAPKALARRSCAPQPAGSGPSVIPDTPAAFLSDPAFGTAANSAATPQGYYQVFKNLNASNNAYDYLTYETLTSYNTSTCAAFCSATAGCTAFNIYFERDPTVNPDSPSCGNPSSTTNIKCALWGAPISTANAVNYGQYRGNFSVVIAGSNGYVLNDTQGYTGPTQLGNCVINAPLDCNGQNTYLGEHLFPGSGFDAGLCTQFCSNQTAYNVAHPAATGTTLTCQFIDTYLLFENGNVLGQVCAMYSETWSSTYATNCGYSAYNATTGKNDVFTIADSETFSNSTNPGTCAESS